MDTHGSGATHESSSNPADGAMDISDHVKTWLAFWKGAQWAVGIIILIVIFLAIFRTHNG